ADQRDVGRSIGIVFQALDPGVDSVFVTLKVHQAVVLLMPAADMPGSNAATAVATTCPVFAFQQRSMGRSLVQVGVLHTNDEAASRRSRFTLFVSHRSSLFLRYRKCDLLTVGQTDVRFLPIGAPTFTTSCTPGFPLDVHSANTLHLD